VTQYYYPCGARALYGRLLLDDVAAAPDLKGTSSHFFLSFFVAWRGLILDNGRNGRVKC
jgi:hypothetical protein